MEKITTVGLDLAKQVMAVHGVGVDGRVLMRRVLRRDQLLRWTATLLPCVVAMEACSGAHYWARELTRQGHTVRIIAAEFVQAFRKSGKNDANDAEAICTATRQPNMRFVAMKSVQARTSIKALTSDIELQSVPRYQSFNFTLQQRGSPHIDGLGGNSER
jgi:transposase